MGIVIKLPFPAAALFPNRKNGKHWTSTSKSKDAQHHQAYLLALQAAPGALKSHVGYLPLSLLFVMPDKRHRDADNMLAASKALLDGMSEALGIDDSRYKPVLVDWVHGTDKLGALIVNVGDQIYSGKNLDLLAEGAAI